MDLFLALIILICIIYIQFKNTYFVSEKTPDTPDNSVAKTQGEENISLFVLIGFFFNLLVLVIYYFLISRPTIVNTPVAHDVHSFFKLFILLPIGSIVCIVFSIFFWILFCHKNFFFALIIPHVFVITSWYILIQDKKDILNGYMLGVFISMILCLIAGIIYQIKISSKKL